MQPLIDGLNPQHYMARLVEIQVLAAETQTSLFELYFAYFTKNNKKVKRMNKAGNRALKNWAFVSDYMVKEKQDASQSFINCQYNMGRIYSKLKTKTNLELKVLSFCFRCCIFIRKDINNKLYLIVDVFLLILIGKFIKNLE